MMNHQQQQPVLLSPMAGSMPPPPPPSMCPPPHFNDHVFHPGAEQMYMADGQHEQQVPPPIYYDQRPPYYQHQPPPMNQFPMENSAYHVYYDANLSTWIYCPYITVHYPMYPPAMQPSFLPGTINSSDNCELICQQPPIEQPQLPNEFNVRQEELPLAAAAPATVDANQEVCQCNGDIIQEFYMIAPEEQCNNNFLALETIYEEDNSLYPHMVFLKDLDYSVGTIQCNCIFESDDMDITDFTICQCEYMHDSATG